jgi:hypothetical protein
MALLAGCSGQSAGPGVHSVRWTAVDLPASGRVLVRGAFECGDDLVVLGATADATGSTSPAAWRLHGLEVRPLTLHPHHDPYAREEILTAGACRPDGRMSLFGSKSGGAHGLPRSSMWAQRPDGSLVATRNPFEVFGGPNVGSYGPMAADDHQWVMVGTRTPGGSVWTSDDAGHYRLHEGAFGPASHVLDVRRVEAGWIAAGFDVADGQLRPQVWTSSDAIHWDPVPLPFERGGASSAQRFAQGAGGRMVVAGFDDGRLALWSEERGEWAREPALPKDVSALRPDGGQPAYVTGAAGTDGVTVTFSDGTDFRAARRSPSGTWQRVTLPERVAVSGDTLVAVRSYDGGLVLLLDDGKDGRVYLEAPAA